jgi:hypothetical protein
VNGKLGSIPLHQITIKDDDEGKVIETQNWIGKDIGNPPTAGEHTINGGTITVKGSGNDIWGTDDQFYYLFKAMKGDGALVAKIDSLEVSTPYAKAGVMIRESLASSSKYSFVVRTAENGLRHHWKQLPSSTPQDDLRIMQDKVINILKWKELGMLLMPTPLLMELIGHSFHPRLLK